MILNLMLAILIWCLFLINIKIILQVCIQVVKTWNHSFDLKDIFYQLQTNFLPWNSLIMLPSLQIFKCTLMHQMIWQPLLLNHKMLMVFQESVENLKLIELLKDFSMLLNIIWMLQLKLSTNHPRKLLAFQPQKHGHGVLEIMLLIWIAQLILEATIRT